MSQPPAETAKTKPEPEAKKKSAKTRGVPKGFWVNPSEEIKAEILARCEESMREPSQEISWILREWFRSLEMQSPKVAEKPSEP